MYYNSTCIYIIIHVDFMCGSKVIQLVNARLRCARARAYMAGLAGRRSAGAPGKVTCARMRARARAS